jgi:hypothetical protein
MSLPASIKAQNVLFFISRAVGNAYKSVPFGLNENVRNKFYKPIAADPLQIPFDRTSFG